MIDRRAFRDCLAQFDVAGMIALQRAASGQSLDEANTVRAMHYARTLANSISFRSRAYSHAWLLDHGLPSGLPDKFKPKAERLYPREVTAVGISVNSLSGKTELCRILEKAMAKVVDEFYLDGVTDPAVINPRMFEAYRSTLKRA